MRSSWQQVELAHRSLLFGHTGYALHAMLLSVGHEKATDASYAWHGLKRKAGEFVLLQHTLEGRGRLRRGGQIWDLNAGQTLLLYMPDDHCYDLPAGVYETNPSQQWRFFYLCLSGGEVVRAWRAMVQHAGPVVTLSSKPGGALTIARQLCLDGIRGRIDSPWLASRCAYDLTMRLMAALMPGGDAAQRHRPAYIQKVVDYVKQHPGQAIDIDELAKVSGYSRHHFSKLFKESEGVSPGDYVIRERLRHAARLLQRTDQPIKAIAMTCDFYDANYFGKMFRKAYGMTPGAFRRSGLYR